MKIAQAFILEMEKYNDQKYILKKFKAKIDFEKGILVSKDLYSGTLNCNKVFGQKFSMTCTSWLGEIFTIEGDKPTIDIFNYVRGETYGRTDSILTAHGNCEKF